MLHLLTGITINLALLAALSYLRTFAIVFQPTEKQKNLYRLYELLISSVSALILLAFPVQLSGSLLIDLRCVPILLMGMRHGYLWAFLTIIPVALYRYHLGGAGAVPSLFALLAMVVFSGLAHQMSVRQNKAAEDQLGMVLMVSLAPIVGFFLVPEGFVLFQTVVPVLYAATVAGLLTSAMILRHKKHLMQFSEQMQQAALLDPLTGLGNRRKFEQDQRNFPLAAHLLALDLDHFKRINDTYGHGIGDQALITVGRVLQSHTRSGDQVYRMGGEEFLVMIHHPEHQRAYDIAERLRKAITVHVAEHLKVIEQPLTCSAGLSWLGEGIKPALEQADQQLYEAKHAGRNRTGTLLPVQRAEDPVPTALDGQQQVLLQQAVLFFVLNDLHVVVYARKCTGELLLTSPESARFMKLALVVLDVAGNPDHEAHSQQVERQVLQDGCPQTFMVEGITENQQHKRYLVKKIPLVLQHQEQVVLTVVQEVAL
ncbi:diguanylate cyclase [Deinococcus misasensis]|uniref:diguanylate cyclase n=1 Tax=Deinococcus misasensis TaxID=392413 RepID=UPI00055531CC|nr:diguanylate cyclase [Deinococcus misasensis]